MVLHTQSSETINIAAIGLDESGKSRLDLIFKTQFKGQCRFSSLSDADMVLMDVSAKNGKELKSLEKMIAEHSSLPHINFWELP